MVDAPLPAQAYDPATAVYEIPIGGPWRLGTLMSKTWKAPFVSGVTQTWAERIRGYWDRIEQRYGYVMSDHRNAYDKETATITTFATPIAMLKGTRRPNRERPN